MKAHKKEQKRKRREKRIRTDRERRRLDKRRQGQRNRENQKAEQEINRRARELDNLLGTEEIVALPPSSQP